MPLMPYGTTWKKERTYDLVVEAVRAGFRGIDAACQPNVFLWCADVLMQIILVPDLSRTWSWSSIDTVGWLSSAFNVKIYFFLQTKFTSINDQDPLRRIP